MSNLENNSDPPPPVFQYKVGDEVLARWSDGKDYPGTISSYFPDGAYNVIFQDGYRKKVKAKYIAPLPKDHNKTLVPLSSVPSSTPITEATTPSQNEGDKAPRMEVSLVPAPLTHPPKEFFIEEDHNHFKCPAPNCTKAFRKEKTLSGHLKHYHPELNSQSKRRSKPPANKQNDLSISAKEMPATKIPETIALPVEEKPTKRPTVLPSKDSHKSPSKNKKDKNESQNIPVTDKESNACHKSPTKSSNVKQEETSIPIKKNHEPLDNNLNVYMPLELQMSCEVTTSNSSMAVFSPSTVKKEPTNQQGKKESYPKPANNQQQQQATVQTPPAGKKRGRKRKSELEANELARLKEEKDKSNKVRVVEKLSSVSPSMMFLEESNPVPNPVLPFSDPRTIREIHESDDVDELVNCICDLRKESGLMVQCECCLTWQHGSCLGIKADKDLPDVYVCFICKNPRGSREKCRYKYDWTWLRNGALPLFPGYDSAANKLNSANKKKIMATNQLLNAALEILNIIHDLKHKIQLLDQKNADLSLWNTSWVASKETKILPPREQEIVHNDFVGLKVNENDMINDILDFSKNILETVPSDDKTILETVVSDDKNVDLPDDLEIEIAEGTDLIEFIASSCEIHSEMNGIKEKDTITEIEPEVVEENPTTNYRQNLIEHILDVQNRLTQRIDILESKVSEFEKEYNLDPDPTKLEQDIFTFKNLIKDLYVDLEIVHQMSLCTTN